MSWSWLRLARIGMEFDRFDRSVSFRFFFEVIILRLPVSSGIQGNGNTGCRGAGYLCI